MNRCVFQVVSLVAGLGVILTACTTDDVSYHQAMIQCNQNHPQPAAPIHPVQGSEEAITRELEEEMASDNPRNRHQETACYQEYGPE